MGLKSFLPAAIFLLLLTAPAHSKETQIPENLTLSAHRGGSYAPENTLMAFERALETGANSVEFDVRDAEGGFAVIHDRTASRTTGEDLVVSDTDLARLTDLPADEDYVSGSSDLYVSREEAEKATIPSYVEAREYFKRTDALLRIDVKGEAQESGGAGSGLYREVERREMGDQTVFMSFSGTCVPRGLFSGRFCNWEVLEGVEEASDGEARTAVLWQKRRDPRKNPVDGKNLDIRHALREAEKEGFDMVVARDGDNSINGLRQSSMTRKQFVGEAERKNLGYAFMGFRGSRKEQIECGVEWVSTNYPASLREKVGGYEDIDMEGNNCGVDRPARFEDVGKTVRKGFRGVYNHRAEILAGTVGNRELNNVFDWSRELVNNTVSSCKRFRAEPQI